MIIGIIGGGQLGMMMAKCAQDLNHIVYSYDENRTCSIKKYSKVHYIGKFSDYNKLYDFCLQCDVITYEFENLNYEVLDKLSNEFEIYPNANALKQSQNRLYEKELANKLGILTAKYYYANNINTINLERNSIIKTINDGYDGKGQCLVTKENLNKIKTLLKSPCIVEEIIDFDFEVSLVINRDRYKTVYSFPITKNFHKNGILKKSVVPVDVCDEVYKKVQNYSILLIEYLDIVGTLAVEFFVKNSEVYFNEMAPRPHNSFHHTIESCDVSQFLQHIKCITGLKITRPILLHSAKMINIIGDDNSFDKNGFIHMYDKKVVRKGRKMGHITYIGGLYE